MPNIVYEVQQLFINEERDIEREPNSLVDEVNIHDIDRERADLVETVDE